MFSFLLQRCAICDKKGQRTAPRSRICDNCKDDIRENERLEDKKELIEMIELLKEIRDMLKLSPYI